METEHGLDSEAPANERAGNRQAQPKPPRHISTLPQCPRIGFVPGRQRGNYDFINTSLTINHAMTSELDTSELTVNRPLSTRSTPTKMPLEFIGISLDARMPPGYTLPTTRPATRTRVKEEVD